MTTWFTSDQHYGHRAIISYSNRPFEDIFDMEAALIDRYKALVQPNDTVIWVGDTFFTPPEESAEILRQLPGRKVLVRGNHDKSAAAMARIGFELVTDSLTMHIAGHTVRVHHYPYSYSAHAGERERLGKNGLVWPDRHSGEALIHGHTHAKERRNGRAIHVGVDAWDYCPASIWEIEELVVEAFKQP